MEIEMTEKINRAYDWSKSASILLVTIKASTVY